MVLVISSSFNNSLHWALQQQKIRILVAKKRKDKAHNGMFEFFDASTSETCRSSSKEVRWLEAAKCGSQTTSIELQSSVVGNKTRFWLA